MRKPRALGKAAGSHKLKKTQLSSDSSDEDDDMGDTQVCQYLIIVPSSQLTAFAIQPVSQGASSSSVNSSSSESDSSSSSESLKFDDGWDDDFIGDEEDRKRLEQMTEAEREQEMFNRSA